MATCALIRASTIVQKMMMMMHYWLYPNQIINLTVAFVILVERMDCIWMIVAHHQEEEEDVGVTFIVRQDDNKVPQSIVRRVNDLVVAIVVVDQNTKSTALPIPPILKSLFQMPHHHLLIDFKRLFPLFLKTNESDGSSLDFVFLLLIPPIRILYFSIYSLFMNCNVIMIVSLHV